VQLLKLKDGVLLLLPYTTTSSLSLPAVRPSLSNSTTTLSDIDFWDIDDNLLLETLMQIENVQ
jgi:hypothetical protein